MDKETIIELQGLFDSIVCLALEGPEFHTKLELMKAIEKEAMRGYELCKRHLSKSTKQTKPLRKLKFKPGHTPEDHLFRERERRRSRH